MTATSDSLGEIEIPDDALYGAQTQRAIMNFPLSGIPMPKEFIQALGLIKGACANTNYKLGLLDKEIANVIEKAALEIAEGNYFEQFPIDVFQTGSGTSTNMNANEVIASLASRYSGQEVHPNDDVNKSQSSNDVIPSCIHLSAALSIHNKLLPALEILLEGIELIAKKQGDLIKTGRTHLMDAMPLTVAQELSAWTAQIDAHQRRILHITHEMQENLAIGGTAVGTGINAHPDFGKMVAAYITCYSRTSYSSQQSASHQNTSPKNTSKQKKLSFKQTSNTFRGLNSQDTAVSLSGELKSLATSLMKISNDLRWMNSGPYAGLAEVQLPTLQPGSSIMPGKVNPVMPEALCMICAQVIGNDAAITIAGQSGNFQLNVMLPLVAYNLQQSIGLLASGSQALAQTTIAKMSYNSEKLEQTLSQNPILITALNAVIGYEKGAEIVKRTNAEQRPLIEVALEMTDLDRETLERLLDPAQLTHPASTEN